MAKKTFESALTKLEKITQELEEGEISLENSLKKFNEGIQLATYCTEQLNNAKTQVEMLLEKDGELTAIPFGENDSES